MLVAPSLLLLSAVAGAPTQTAAAQAQSPPSATVAGQPAPTNVAPAAARAAMPADTTPDYPGAIWVSAAPTNYQPANRPVDEAINMIVIHDIEGTAESAVRWFENPKAKVTSHYVVDSVTGTIYQLVKERDIAWHAGNHDVNHHAVGIEHEGYAYKPGFYNPVEYEASAKLVRAISSRYNIPRDRTHIIGHFEVPNAAHPGQFGGSGGHTDPGPWWDWDSYMTLVRNDAALQQPSPTLSVVLHPGESVRQTLTFTNTGDDLWASPVKSTGADKASETTTAASQRALGLIYLGTWNPDFAPLSPASVFYGKGWASPRYIVPAASDTAPGAAGTFIFDLHGPRTLGPVIEQYRLFKLAVAPHAPVAFGPAVTASVQVVPWDLTIDTVSPAGAFAAPGWKQDSSGNTPTFSIEAPNRAGDALAAPAVWTTTLPIDGQWDVYVRSPVSKRSTKKANYSVTTVGGATALVPQAVAVNQAASEGDWQKLGRFALDGMRATQVTLAAGGDPGSVVTADAVRFVGPFLDHNAPKGPDPSLFQPGVRP